jgi:hypothetical protein
MCVGINQARAQHCPIGDYFAATWRKWLGNRTNFVDAALAHADVADKLCATAAI